MTTETKTDFDWIAGLIYECGCKCHIYPDTGEYHQWKECDCEGDEYGRRYRFPWLWRKCGGIASSPKRGELIFVHDGRCCNKMDYVLIEAERWTDALQKTADTIPEVQETVYWYDVFYFVDLIRNDDSLLSRGTSEESYQEALASAVRKALGV